MPEEQKQTEPAKRNRNMRGEKTNVPTATLGLFVSAKNLTDLDVITASDPFCALMLRDKPNEVYKKVGQTEVVDNNLNPKWVE